MARAAAAAAWAAAITAGAVALHYARLPGLLGAAANWEPAHVVAHLFLYGALAVLVARWLGGLGWKVFAVVAAAGFAQEASQTLLFGIPMGAHEAKDLATDLVGAAAAVAAQASWRARRAARAGGAEGAGDTGDTGDTGEAGDTGDAGGKEKTEAAKETEGIEGAEETGG